MLHKMDEALDNDDDEKVDKLSSQIKKLKEELDRQLASLARNK